MAKIQIIDDDVELSANTASILQSAGHETATRDTTEGSLEFLVENKPDLLVLDVMFPENPAGGFDLARKVREREELKDLPIIMLTAINQEFPMDFSSQDIDEDWLPVQGFVEKPVDIPTLLKKVDEVLA